MNYSSGGSGGWDQLLRASQAAKETLASLGSAEELQSQLNAAYNANSSITGTTPTLGTQALDAVSDRLISAMDEFCANEDVVKAQQLSEQLQAGASQSELASKAAAMGLDVQSTDFGINKFAQALGSASPNSGSGVSGIQAYIEANAQAGVSLNSNNYSEYSDGIVLSYIAYIEKLMTAGDDPTFKEAATVSDITVGEYLDVLTKKLEQVQKNQQRMLDDGNLSSADSAYLTGKLKQRAEFLEFMKAVKGSDRYKNLEIVHNESKWDDPEISDHVMAFKYPDGGIVIAFEGSDGTIAAWKSNGDLLGIEESLAEKWAREQVGKILGNHEGESPIDMVGHSRGGHMAIYTFLTTERSKKVNIRKVTSLDGPGFNEKRLAENPMFRMEFERLASQITNYLPDCSAVGRIGILPGKVYAVALSDNSRGFFASHEAFAWAVSADGQPIMSEFTPASDFIHTISLLLTEFVSPEDIDALFERVMDIFAFEWGGENLMESGSITIEKVVALIADVVSFLDIDNLLYTIAPDTVKKPLEILGKIRDVVDDIGTVAKVAAFLGVPYAGVVVAGLEILSTLIVVAEGLVVLGAYVVEYFKARKEEKKRQAREAYANGNPLINVNFTGMDSGGAITMLREANSLLQRADRKMDQLRSPSYHELESIDIVLGVLSMAGQLIDVGLKDFFFVGPSKTIDKMVNALCEIIDGWRAQTGNMASVADMSLNEIVTRVNPGALQSAARAAITSVQVCRNEADSLKQYTITLQQKWDGDDYQSYKQLVSKEVGLFDDQAKNYYAYFQVIEYIGGEYAKLRDDTLKIVQNV